MNSSFDRRYIIVAAAFTIQAVMIGSMFAYGVFFKVLETELGWSRTLLAGSSSVSMLVMGLLAMLGGRLSDRFGPRWVLVASSVCFGIGYALMYFLTTPWQLFLFYGVLVGIGLSTHDVVTLSTIARWFQRRRGIMTGIVKVGTACGQVVIPLVATLLIGLLGWRTACLIMGLGGMVILVIAAQSMRAYPGDAIGTAAHSTTATPTGPPTGSPTGGDQPLSFAAALRTRQFATLCIVQLMFFPSLVTIPVHIAAHGMDLGMAVTSAAALLSVIGGVSIAGRLFIGSAVDRLGGRVAMLICLSFLLVSLLWLRWFADSAWMLFVFAGVYGFAHGGLFTSVSPTIAEFFGMKAHGALFGVVLFCGTIGGAIGPLLAGYIFDHTGSYDMAFNVLALFAVIGLILVATLRPIVNRRSSQSVETLG